MADEQYCLSFSMTYRSEVDTYLRVIIPAQREWTLEQAQAAIHKHLSEMRYPDGGIVLTTKTPLIAVIGNFLNENNLSSCFKKLKVESGFARTSTTGLRLPNIIIDLPDRINTITQLENNVYESVKKMPDGETCRNAVKQIIATLCSYYDPQKDNDGFNQAVKEKIKPHLDTLKKHPQHYQNLLNEIEYNIFKPQLIWSNNNPNTSFNLSSLEKALPQITPEQNTPPSSSNNFTL